LPQGLSRLPIEQIGILSPDSGAQHVDISNDGNAVISFTNAGIQILSLAVPRNPIELANIQTSERVVRFRRFGAEGFAISQTASLQKFDLSDLTRPKEVQTYGLRQVADVARDVVVLQRLGKDFVVIGSQFQGVAAYSEREGELVRFSLGNAISYSLVNQMEIRGEYLFISDYRNGLKILSLDEWPQLRLVSEVPIGGVMAGFRIAGDRVWISAMDGGVLSVDISDVNAPKIDRRIPLPGLTRDVVVANNRALVAYDNIAGDYGLALFDISDQDSSRLITSWQSPGIIRSLGLHEGVVLAADDVAGVFVLDVEGFAP
jgi:hypothetical protein